MSIVGEVLGPIKALATIVYLGLQIATIDASYKLAE